MDVKHLLTPVAALDAAEARAFIGARPPGEVTILDVRQPGEYSASHIPGARLAPLPDLHDELGKLDREKPAIVYCAVGGRSRVAAQILSGRGFREVYNLSGGINAWEGAIAVSPPDFHLRFLAGDEPPAEMLALALATEEGLARLYAELRGAAKDREVAETFGLLQGVEKTHAELLRRLMKGVEGAETPARAAFLEGGLERESFLAENARYFSTVTGVLDVAMMVEAQALDLYMRCAVAARNEKTAEGLRQLAREERAHLRTLGRLMESRGGSR